MPQSISRYPLASRTRNTLTDSSSKGSGSSIRWMPGITSSKRPKLHRVAGVIRAPHQRTRFHVSETHFLAGPLEIVELVLGHVTDNRQVLPRGPQILSQRENADMVRAQIAHHSEHFARGQIGRA